MGNIIAKAFTPGNFLDRIAALEKEIAEIKAYALTAQNADRNQEDPTAAVMSGWVANGTQLKSVEGTIVLDSETPAITIGDAEDFDTGIGIFEGNDGGTYKWRVGDPAGYRASWDGATLYVNGAVTSPSLNPAMQGWGTSIVFSSTDNDTVSWTAGTILTTGGLSYSINAGNTGNMAALTYVFLDVAVSTTVLRLTTTYSAAQGDGRILVAAAQNHAAGASVIPFGGQQPIINATDQITALSIVAGNIAAGAVTATKISVVNLAAIAANIGACHIDGVLDIGVNGGIYQGTGTFASPTTGLKIWNDGGVGRIGGYSAGVLQIYFGTDGKLYAGAGGVKLDAGGLTVRGMGSGDVFEEGGTITTIKLTSPVGDIVKGQIYYQGTNNILSAVGIRVNDYGTAVGVIRLDNKTILVHGLDVGYTASAAGNGEIIASQDGRFGGGLYVGATNVDPAAGTLTVACGDVGTGVCVNVVPTSTAIAGTAYGVHAILYVNPAGASSSVFYGYRGGVRSLAGCAQNLTTSFRGVESNVLHLGSGTLANLYGFYATIAVDAGVVTNAYGLYVPTFAASGGGSFGTTYAIYTGTDKSSFGGNVAFRAVSPASLSAHTNNWNPGVGSFVRVTSNNNYNITGMAAGVDGEIRHIVNIGVYALTLIHESASSTAANRFSLKGYADFIVAKKGGITLIYDATDARWRSVAYTY